MGLFGFGKGLELSLDARQGGGSVGTPKKKYLSPDDALPDEDERLNTDSALTSMGETLTAGKESGEFDEADLKRFEEVFREQVQSSLLQAGKNIAESLPDGSGQEHSSIFENLNNLPGDKVRLATRFLKAMTVSVFLSSVLPNVSFARDRFDSHSVKGERGQRMEQVDYRQKDKKKKKRSTIDDVWIKKRDRGTRKVLNTVFGDIWSFPSDAYNKTEKKLGQQESLNEQLTSLARVYNDKLAREDMNLASAHSKQRDSMSELQREDHEKRMKYAYDYLRNFRKAVSNLPFGVSPLRRDRLFYNKVLSDWRHHKNILNNWSSSQAGQGYSGERAQYLDHHSLREDPELHDIGGGVKAKEVYIDNLEDLLERVTGKKPEGKKVGEEPGPDYRF